MLQKSLTTTISLGETYTGNTLSINNTWFEFTPETTGKYLIDSASSEDITVRVYSDNEEVKSGNTNRNSVIRDIELTEGVTYRINVSSEKSTDYSLTVLPFESKETTVKLNEETVIPSSYKEDTWVKFVAEKYGKYCFISSVQPDVTMSLHYESKDKQSGSVSSSSSSDTLWETYEMFPGDTMYVRFVPSNYYDTYDISFSVKANCDEATEITEGTEYFSEYQDHDTYKIYKFVPQQDGEYKLSFNTSGSDGYSYGLYYDDDISSENLVGKKDGRYVLNKDEEVYLRVYNRIGYDSNYLFSINLYEISEKSLTTSTPCSGEFSSNIEEWIKLIVTKEADYFFKVDNSEAYIMLFDNTKYNITDNNNDLCQDAISCRLSSGIYYLRVMPRKTRFTGSYVLTAGIRTENEISTEPGKEYSADRIYDQINTYVFTAPEDGKYFIYANSDISLKLDVYTDLINESYSGEEIYQIISLKKGEEMYCKMDSFRNYKSAGYNFSVNSYTETVKTVEADKVYNETYAKNNKTTYEFTADTTGYYYISAESESDITVTGNGNSEINTSDISPANKFYMEAGQKIEFVIENSYGLNTLSYSFKVSKVKTTEVPVECNGVSTEGSTTIENDTVHVFTAEKDGKYNISISSGYCMKAAITKDKKEYQTNETGSYSKSFDIYLNAGESVYIYAEKYYPYDNNISYTVNIKNTSYERVAMEESVYYTGLYSNQNTEFEYTVKKEGTYRVNVMNNGQKMQFSYSVNGGSMAVYNDWDISKTIDLTAGDMIRFKVSKYRSSDPINEYLIGIFEETRNNKTVSEDTDYTDMITSYSSALYEFTADSAANYVFSTDSEKKVNIEIYSDSDLKNRIGSSAQESNRLNISIAEGDTVYVLVYNYSDHRFSEVNCKFRVTKYKNECVDLPLNTKVSGYNNEFGKTWFKFVAPEDGYYSFRIWDTNTSWHEVYCYNNFNDQDSNYVYCFNTSRSFDLTAGQEIYFYSKDYYYNNPIEYKMSATKNR